MSSNGQMVQTPGGLAPIARPPLLISESAEEYAALLAALQHEIKPNGPVEQIYLEDMTAIVWEIQRLRRGKTAMINIAFRAALQSLMQRLLLTPGIFSRFETDNSATALSDGWFDCEKSKKEVMATLRRFNLDETAIEAEAIRQSLPDLELIERMEMSLRSRLDKALACIADYRESFARRMRQSSDRILEIPDAINLDHVPA